MFQNPLSALLVAAGLLVAPLAALAQEKPKVVTTFTVIADIARVEPEEVVDAWPDIPILGYTNHTDKSGLQRAHTACFDQVIVKSALVERAPQVVEELVATPG